MDKKRLIAVVGPTASGKTALAVELAKKYNGEVVSADSMQIYKGMTIATAKPTPEETRGIPHHLIDFLSPGEKFSVADYVVLARQTIDDIISRNRTPILCGGTGLYVRSVVENISYTPVKTDDALRARLTERLEREGAEALIKEIESFDPETAKTLNPGAKKRIVRAIEIYKTTGITMSEQNRLSRQSGSPYDTCEIGITYSDRQKLYDRINRRVDIMLKNGLVEEARAFYAGDTSVTSVGAIGYKELKPYLDGKEELSVCVERLKQETRRYAKRQLTWFRRDEYIHWIYADKCESVTEEAIKIIDNNGV